MSAAKALGVNFRTFTGSVGFGKLSRRMRAALVKEIQAGVSNDEEERQREDDRQVEGLKQQVESLEAEMHSIRKELNAEADRIGAMESRLSETRNSLSPGTGSNAGVEEGASKVAGSPCLGHGLPTPIVMALEPQPQEREAFGSAVPWTTSALAGWNEQGQRNGVGRWRSK